MFKTPQGGQVTYQIETEQFGNAPTDPDVTSVLVKKKFVLNRGETEPKVWSYTYNIAPAAVGDSSVETPTGAKIAYQTDEEGRVTQRTLYKQDGAQWTSVEAETRTYIALPIAREPIGTVHMTAKQPETREITRNGRVYRTEYRYRANTYADYHRPWMVIETGDLGLTRTTEYAYAHSESTTSLNVGHVSEEKVTVGGGPTYIRSWVWQAGTSRLDSQQIYSVTTTYSNFNVLAQPGTITDANLNATTVAYTYGLPSRMTTPKHRLDREVMADGTIASETMGVGTSHERKTRYEYDSAFRLKKIIPPGGRSETTIDYDPAGTWTESRRGGSVTRTTVDGFGRPIETVKDGVSVTMRYDAEGRKIFDGYPVAVGATAIGTVIEYDVFGRVTKRTNPGTPATFSTVTYGAGTVTIRDEKGRDTIQLVQAFGNPDETRLAGLTDANNRTWTYQYNTLGKLTKVIAPDSKERSWSYDAVSGLLTSETHPESGTMTYTYDLVGNLKTRTDAKQQVVSYDYDQNNRLTKITATPEVVDLTYEAGSDNRETTTANGLTTTFRYDDGGRLNRIETPVNGQKREIIYSVDETDNVRTMVYPSLRAVQYDYNTANQITRISDVIASRNYATNMTWHPSGALAGYTAGNNIPFSFTYDPSRYWPLQVTSGALGLTYGYDEVGNVTSIADSRGGSWDQTLTYDPLDRLFTSNGPYGNMAYQYDDHGNMTQHGADAFGYNSTTLRMTTRNGQSIGYDDNGSMTSDPQGTYTYTLRNQPATATVSGTTTTYKYDADEWRSMKVTSTGTVYYFRTPGGQLMTEMTVPTSGATTYRDYIYAGSRLIAVVER